MDAFKKHGALILKSPQAAKAGTSVMVNPNEFYAALADLNRKSDQVFYAALTVENLLDVIERQGFELNPLDRMAVEKARRWLAESHVQPDALN